VPVADTLLLKLTAIKSRRRLFLCGAFCHACCALIVVAYVVVPDPMIAWIESHRPRTQGGPSYSILLGYLIVAFLVLGIVGITCYCFGLAISRMRNAMNRSARWALRCSHCDYDTRNIPGPVCPECGTAIDRPQ